MYSNVCVWSKIIFDMHWLIITYYYCNLSLVIKIMLYHQSYMIILAYEIQNVFIHQHRQQLDDGKHVFLFPMTAFHVNHK